MPIEVEWQLSCQNKRIHDLSSAGSEKKGLCIHPRLFPFLLDLEIK